LSILRSPNVSRGCTVDTSSCCSVSVRANTTRPSTSSRASHLDWRKVADRGLEIVICIGHIVGVVMLVADHLF
jgi:hypothetical protein